MCLGQFSNPSSFYATAVVLFCNFLDILVNFKSTKFSWHNDVASPCLIAESLFSDFVWLDSEANLDWFLKYIALHICLSTSYSIYP